MTYANGQYRWAGRVYDGPLEGDSVVKEQPYFEFQWTPRTSLGVYGPGEIPEMAYLYRMVYRWSNPLRAWVFDWRTAPQPQKPRPSKPIDYRSKPRAGNS